jgi:hypothetical protein
MKKKTTMTIGHAKNFIQHGLQEGTLRTRLNASTNATEIFTVLKKENLAFSTQDFDEVFHNLLTQCQEREQADQLRVFKMWWDLTMAMSDVTIADHQ